MHRLFQRAVFAPCAAFSAADAFAVIYFARIHFAQCDAGVTADAFRFVDADSENCEFIKKRINRAERAKKSAKGAEHKNRPHDEYGGDGGFPRKKHAGRTPKLFVQQNERYAGSDRSRGAHEFAKKRRAEAVFKIKRERQRDAQNKQKRVFEKRELSCKREGSFCPYYFF